MPSFLQQNRGGEREHQQRQATIAQQEPAGDKARESGEQRSRYKGAQGLAPMQPDGRQRHGIGADAEERRMPERDDPGITQDQIEREREHDGNQHLGGEGDAVWKQEKDSNDSQPRQRLAEMEAMPPGT